MVALCGYHLLFAFHLLDIVTRFDILQSVVKSVTKNFAALSLTVCLLDAGEGVVRVTGAFCVRGSVTLLAISCAHVVASRGEEGEMGMGMG